MRTKKNHEKSAQICPEIIKVAAILEFWRPYLYSTSILGDLFLLENVAPSLNLILKCKIPLNLIKQGMFILPAKFEPYFHTCECKWIGFSQNLVHISLSLIKIAKKTT